MRKFLILVLSVLAFNFVYATDDSQSLDQEIKSLEARLYQLNHALAYKKNLNGRMIEIEKETVFIIHPNKKESADFGNLAERVYKKNISQLCAIFNCQTKTVPTNIYIFPDINSLGTAVKREKKGDAIDSHETHGLSVTLRREDDRSIAGINIFAHYGQTSEEYQISLKHEITHAYLKLLTQEKNYNNPLPLGIDEGLAHVLVGDGVRSSFQLVEEISKEDLLNPRPLLLLPVKELRGDNTFEDAYYRGMVHAQSASMVFYLLIQPNGWQKLERYINEGGKNGFSEDLFKRVWGFNFARFQKEWQDWLYSHKSQSDLEKEVSRLPANVQALINQKY